jgi:hypothetical protein
MKAKLHKSMLTKRPTDAVWDYSKIRIFIEETLEERHYINQIFLELRHVKSLVL